MIWLDMDGVTADFDAHYLAHFGYKPGRWPEPESTDWAKVQSVPNFYRTIPMMPDARVLLEGLKGREFKMLTGVPKSVETQATNEKVEWIRANVDPIVGREVAVQCCRSRNKWQYCAKLDTLIDDYLKYRDLWLAAGGIFIHHTSAQSSLDWLRELGL